MQIKDCVDGVFANDLHVLLEKKAVMLTKKNTSFLKATLRDQTGSLDGVCWNYDPATDATKEGDVVLVSGQIGSYSGTPQITLSTMVKSDKPVDSFARWTKFDIEKLWNGLAEKVDSFKEPLTKFVAEELLLRHQSVIEALKKAPAAKTVHNNWFGGLLEHIWSLCEIAEPIIAHYQKNYLDKISRDKVLFGLMLHDAGKIIEYDFKSPVFTFTPVGTFTPHIVLGPAWVYEQANKWWEPQRALDPEVRTMGLDRFKLERAHLMHVLAAHHGQLEWGSPVRPASIEAILVHHLDNLDSKVMHAWDFIMNKPGTIEGFSTSSYFEKTGFYNYSE